MIEIYRREYGKDRLVRTFASFEQMFSSYIREEDLKASFGYNPTERVIGCHRLFNEVDRYYGETLISDFSHCYVAYEDGKLVTPDTLVGWYRYFWSRRVYKARNYHHRHGRRRTAWGGHRKVRTTHERRWAHAWDDEEHMVPVRGQRRGHNLPNSWDDLPSWNQKSWKHQSKRGRQWRPK